MSEWSDPDERIFSWLILIALFPVGVLIALATRPRFLFLVTSPTWLCAYVTVVSRNYKKKLPIPGFAGRVEYEKQPILYQSLYGLLLLMGAFVALCMFVLQASRSLL